MTTDDAWLEALLKDGDRVLPDAGFTDRVVATLPAKRTRWLRRRDGVVLGATIVAGGLGCLALSDPSLVAVALSSPVHWMAAATGVGLSLWAAWTAAMSEV
jgi:hypothetical protein